MPDKVVEYSFSKCFERFLQLRWFTPDPIWCHGACGLGSLLLGMLLLLKACAGNFDCHDSYLLYAYYYTTFVVVGSTWGSSRLIPAYAEYYKANVLQELPLIYLGLRFRPGATDLGIPSILVQLADIAATASMAIGVHRGIRVSLKTRKGESKGVDTALGDLQLGLSVLTAATMILPAQLAIGVDGWLNDLLQKYGSQRMALTAFTFVPATLSMTAILNFNNLKNR